MKKKPEQAAKFARQSPAMKDIAANIAAIRGDSASKEALQNMQAPKSHKDAKQQVKFMAQQLEEMRSRPQPDQAAIQQQSMAKKAKDTILQTSDLQKVKAKVAELVEALQ